ncbi:LacI family DNA-binding transcriptional regulator [Sphingomonas bacterium]|uniref:LacI family DNA-binding transcriptional regulator n=1 Tax=Sphingomonas bacterium TaxID=1895847 RepID=UPI00157532CE|nr:LacI family DNA-binding transcriptional regulator [Sphingomonas bacterium]
MRKHRINGAASTSLAGGRRPTSYDVAQLAGVSQSAVSRCFRSGGSIAPATRKRVLNAADALGYQPNAIASGLTTSRSNLVAVLISRHVMLYYPEVLDELSGRLDELNVRMLLFTLRHEGDVKGVLDQVWRHRVDGAIAAVHLDPEQIGAFERHHVPIVLYNRRSADGQIPSVCCESHFGEKWIVDRLHEAGARSFGIITGPPDSFVSSERVDGAQDRLRELGIIPNIVEGAFDPASGAQGLRALIEMTGGKLDAVVCVNDQMAIGAIDEARGRCGLVVPRDISIVGFDGTATGRLHSYDVTTIRQPVERMTEAAAAMLIERIAAPDLPPEIRSFAGKLIAGSTAMLAGT